MNGTFNRALRSVLGVTLGLALGLVVTAIAGESPWTVLTILAKSAFGSLDDFAMTLFYATPLIFTGLSVAIAFHAGLFNIGAEGQLTFGALSAAAEGMFFLRAWPVCAPSACWRHFAEGGLGIPSGWLRARRGSHEVITTIMLNFVAAGLASYDALRSPKYGNPES